MWCVRCVCGMKMHELAKVPSSASTNRKAGKCLTSEYQQPSKDLNLLSMYLYGTGTKFSQEDIVYVTEAWCFDMENTSIKSASMEVAHHIGMMLEGPDAGLRRVAQQQKKRRVRW